MKKFELDKGKLSSSRKEIAKFISVNKVEEIILLQRETNRIWLMPNDKKVLLIQESKRLMEFAEKMNIKPSDLRKSKFIDIDKVLDTVESIFDKKVK